MQDSQRLDGLFTALGNPHRREIVRLLGQQPAAIHQLADIRGLSLPAMNKHLGILENAGLIKRRKTGRTTFLTLNPDPLILVQQWANQFHTHWGSGEGTYSNYEGYLTGAPWTASESNRRRDPS